MDAQTKIALIGAAVGWVLGLISTLGVDEIRRWRQSSAFKRAVRAELEELRYKLAFLVYILRMKIDGIDRSVLEWLLPIVRTYDGPEANSSLLNSLMKMLNYTDEQLSAASRNSQAPMMQKALKRYSLYVLRSQSHELSVLPSGLLCQLVSLQARLDVLNQEVDNYWFYFKKTFDEAISQENYKIACDNMERSYTAIAEQAKLLVEQISQVLPAL